MIVNAREMITAIDKRNPRGIQNALLHMDLPVHADLDEVVQDALVDMLMRLHLRLLAQAIHFMDEHLNGHKS